MPETIQHANTETGRLDVIASQIVGISRALLRTWIDAGAITVNGTVITKASFALRGGEEIVVVPQAAEPSEVLPENIPLTVVFEDEHLIAVDKPAGMLTHPAAHVFTGTLVNALLGRVPLAGEGEDFGPEGYRPGIVHRLDQDTSGVIVVAKTREAHASLARSFANRHTKKMYVAIVVGNPPDAITVDAAVGRHPGVKTKMAVNGTNGRDAKTDFVTLARTTKNGQTHAVVQARIYTGRTHQIRVHLQHLKTPVLGDDVYGKASTLIDRQALHAWRLELQHPVTGDMLSLEAQPPEDMLAAWLALGQTWPNMSDMA